MRLGGALRFAETDYARQVGAFGVELGETPTGGLAIIARFDPSRSAVESESVGPRP